MADKGFYLKVLVPTDDGITISKNGIENSLYYLTYNISNRSYQLAGKKKYTDLFESNFNSKKFKEYLETENIDLVLTSINENYNFSFQKVNIQEINHLLNKFIDLIDKKSANKH